jgi:hypothetical protein
MIMYYVQSCIKLLYLNINEEQGIYVLIYEYDNTCNIAVCCIIMRYPGKASVIFNNEKE